MLKIKNLSVDFEEHPLLEDINLEVKKGETHAIIGEKNSGKSELAFVIMGVPNLEIKSGGIQYKKKIINNLPIEKRCNRGMYITFQVPPLIEGISNFDVMLNAIKFKNPEKNQKDIEQEYKELCTKLDLPDDHGKKNLNNELIPIFEQKKNILLNMIMLDPEFILVDEIDENLDDDEVKFVGEYIKKFLENPDKSAIIITQNKELLEILNPDCTHVMVKGTLQNQPTTEIYKRIVNDGNP